MTAEEFLRLPEDRADSRWLIGGTVWEEPAGFHSLPHAASVPRISCALAEWADGSGGTVACGGAGVRLPGRETVVGLDVVVMDAAAAALPPPPAGTLDIFHGVPRVAVEVLEPDDPPEAVAAVVRELLAAGVPQVWIADPGSKTLTVHRPDGPARTYQGDDAVPGGAALPGLDVRAGDLFGR